MKSMNIIFVADLFSNDYAGGAELTTDALISYGPQNIIKVHSKDVDVKFLQDHQHDYWVFCNFSSLNFNLIPLLIGNINYSVIEYDYKFCQYRSIEKHKAATGYDCDCANKDIGKYVSAFFYGADYIFWMSKGQMDRYHSFFPSLKNRKQMILSSVFDNNFFNVIDVMKNYNDNRDGWIVLGSNSWIKGKDNAIKWCEENNKKYEVIWDIPYEETLAKLASAEGFVYLPAGGDTCPRMVIEAKLLGCEVVTNENVQHESESWWQNEQEITREYLEEQPYVFWSIIEKYSQRNLDISGYTTTYNCVNQNYPFIESVTSMLNCLDEVIVVDGGSTDGTLEKLQQLSNENNKLKVVSNPRDWSDSRSAVFDGDQKAVARRYCTGDLCWQMDVDEIIHENDYQKIRELVKHVHKSNQVIALPVIEFWGANKKVRIDINPWKWRLSRNYPHITHGIPAQLRRYDKEGKLYSAQGTDGCDYIHADTCELIPFVNFHTQETETMRQNAAFSEEFRMKYVDWFTQVTNSLPGVYHYSWYDLERKIKTYKHFWSRHWQSLFDIKQEDTAQNNMFFDKPWAEVTDKDIKELAEKLEKEMCGWIFHRKINWKTPTPDVKIKELTHPSVMSNWIKCEQ